MPCDCLPLALLALVAGLCLGACIGMAALALAMITKDSSDGRAAAPGDQDRG
ncbi:hypothetical protein [Methylibium sp.]|uniref:hypothetical protein n=1 Tax=Methylibium sp. TaxID=2067992 RepID=UPI003D0D48F3